ncbi:hypothetical protein K491DRAFT_574225, partial [Lophiostoma macrostomum CBS 122681]
GKKPTKTIIVPAELRPSLHYEDIKAKCFFWRQETECEVVPMMISGKLMKLDLFGSGTQVAAATRAINKWIQVANTKTAASSAWPKMEAFDANKWWYKNFDENEIERKSKYLGTLLEEHYNQYPLTVIVHWPPQLVSGGINVNPRDAFGNKLEALNEIRMEDEVFITLLPHRRPPWQVEIRGTEPLNVKAAEAHYKNLVQKVLTKQTMGTTSINVILDASEGTHVRWSLPNDWWPHREAILVPRLLTSLVDAGSFRNESLHPRNLNSIEHSIRNSIEAIRFEQGSYVFAIRLGCLALSDGQKSSERYDPVVDIRSFKVFIDGSISCSVQRWLVKRDIGNEVLSRLMQGTRLLEPTRSGGYFGVVPSSLKETKPTFRGYWALRDPNSVRATAATTQTKNSGDGGTRSPPVSLIVVQVEWTEDEEGEYEKMSPRFYRLKQGQAGPKENMDINLLELGDSRGWIFSLESMTIVSKSTVSPAVVAFANSVKMTSGYSQRLGSDELFAQWVRTPSVQIHGGRMEQVYAFGLKDTGYRVEAIKMWYPGQTMPCWGLAVHHREWDLHLGQLERLPLGRGADWNDVIKTFFPGNDPSLTGLKNKAPGGKLLDISQLSISDERGVRLLVGKLMDLSSLVS